MSSAGAEVMMEQQDKGPWSFPLVVDEVPEDGRHIALHADATVRAALAGLAAVLEVPVLDAVFDVARHGRAGLHITGHVEGTVRQTCVVSLEPMTSTVSERVDVVFEPERKTGESDEEIEITADEAEPPEPLIGGQVDLGAIATEFLLLGIDPYPRRPEARFEPPAVSDEPTDHPFAALKGLKPGNKS
jgi:uncharacterized metal-binding protein YceD (DUF177 family)